MLRRFIQRVTGYSYAQVNRLIGRAGFLRIDSVHQGDHEGMKGIYYINVVDCMTRFQAVFAVAAISEAFLVPILSP